MEDKAQYIAIQDWMIHDLHLNGGELITYAIIYEFSRGEIGRFSGRLKYLQFWTNSTKQWVIKVLNSLKKQGFIERHEKYINGVRHCEYGAVLDTKSNNIKTIPMNTCVIMDWMIKELDLKGNELLIYAIIYSHRMGDRGYAGTIQNLAEQLEISRNNASICLKNLIKRQLVTVNTYEENQTIHNEYLAETSLQISIEDLQIRKKCSLK